MIQAARKFLRRSLLNKAKQTLEKLDEEYFKKEELPSLPTGNHT